MCIEDCFPKLRQLRDEHLTKAVDEEESEDMARWIIYACDTEKHEQLICEYLQKDNITLESAVDYVISISPPLEIVDDDEDEDETEE